MKEKEPLSPYVQMITEHIITSVIKKLNKTWLFICFFLAACILALSLVTLVLIKQVNTDKTRYLATNNGFVFPIKTTDHPVYQEKDINGFAATQLNNALQLNFVHIDKQLSDVKQGFTQNGYDSFYKALKSSGLIDEIKAKRLNLKVLMESGSLVTLGRIKGTNIYAWQFKYPLTIQKVNGDGGYASINYEALVQVVRVDTQEKPNGIAVNQIILTPL